MDTIGPITDSAEHGARCHCGHGLNQHWHLVVSDTRTVTAGCVRPACGCNTYRPPR